VTQTLSLEYAIFFANTRQFVLLQASTVIFMDVFMKISVDACNSAHILRRWLNRAPPQDVKT